jgi:membrane peptidoglycan carboxypeptidase
MFLTEDAGFYNHGGIKIGLINRALRLNLNEGRYVYGGSTISQQLVKNLFLSRRKTLSRKLDELFIVWRLESVLSKDRILELYLNCSEFGPDVYGVVQASRFYFDTTPERLSPLQAAYLASLKVAPRHGGKFYLRGFPQGGRWWNKRQKYILVVLAENGYISPAEVLASYPWIPQFVYPDPNDFNDFRTQWMERHSTR